jgi:xylose dehydrogenase (NAD/NADP)
MARELGVMEVVEGYQAVLDQELDCIYIPLPNSEHHRWALAGLARGCHVLCEKPLALNESEALEMTAAATAAGRVLGEAVMYRYHPRWALVRSLIAQREIGEIRQISGNFSFPLRPEPDYRWDPALGGGALYDVGSYLVNAARWLAGREPVEVGSVAVRRAGVDVAASVSLRFPAVPTAGACLASLACGFEAAETEWLAVEGTLGAIQLERPFTAWHDQARPVNVRLSSGLVEELPVPATDPYTEMVRAFHAAVAGGEPLLTSASDGAANLAVLDRCRRSWKESAGAA